MTFAPIAPVTLLAGLLAASAPTASRPTDSPAAGGRWLGTWAAAPQLCEERNLPPAPGFVDRTLRQIVHVSLGGSRLRVRFSNAFGSTALTIASAHLAVAGHAAAIQPGTDRALTFGGRPSVTIPPWALMLSDPLEFRLAPLSNVAVTMRLDGAPAAVTAHPGSRTTSYFVPGDRVTAADLPDAVRAEHWYFLSGLDVVAEGDAAAVAILGDSITDGRGSTTDKNDRWPDVLAQRLQANPSTARLAVLNQGIGGNCLEQECLGPSALARLDRDVLAQDGVRWLIVFEGINDIGTRSGTAQNLIAAYEQIVARAHSHGIRAYGATLLPFEGASYFTPEGEADRQKVNAWIRGSKQFDAVLDFEAAVRDPAQPARLSPAADSGDHLHLSPAGYRTLAEAVALALFAPTGNRGGPALGAAR